MKYCSIDDCGEKHKARGWCNTHYARWRKNGDPHNPGTWIKGDHPRRFWLKVEKTDECWHWQGHVSQLGYGQFTMDGLTVLAHRFAYEDVVGPIPNGLVIDHLCRVRDCVNPEHLEVVTQAENTRRGLSGVLKPALTHCPSGHDYDEENTRYVQGKYPICRTCDRIRKRVEYRALMEVR